MVARGSVRERVSRGMTHRRPGEFSLTRAELIGGSLGVGFSFLDAPVVGSEGEELAAAPEDDCPCGIAVADDGAVFPGCVVSRHPTADGARVLGLIRIGPGVRPDAGRIRIVVVPLAGMPVSRARSFS